MKVDLYTIIRDDQSKLQGVATRLSIVLHQREMVYLQRHFNVQVSDDLICFEVYLRMRKCIWLWSCFMYLFSVNHMSVSVLIIAPLWRKCQVTLCQYRCLRIVLWSSLEQKTYFISLKIYNNFNYTKGHANKCPWNTG